MAVRITFNGDEVAKVFTDNLERVPSRIYKAMEATAQEASRQIKDRGGSDITGAGRFGGRWTESLHADVDGGGSARVEVSVFSTIPYFSVFEYGKTIQGRPLLYFPPGPEFAPLFASANGRVPVVISKHSVTIPQKFHIRDISRDVGTTVPDVFRDKLAEAQ